MTRAYDTSHRPCRTRKASGGRGWHDGPQWRARSRAWLTANPTCTRCPAKATICDNHAPVRPHDREVLALISDGKGRAAEFQPILDQSHAA